MDKTFTIVGISTQAKITKFRVANGDLEARKKVLARNEHTDIDMIQLDTPMSKADAIEAYKKHNPVSESIRMPNEKEAKPAKEVKEKTVTIKSAGKGKGKATTDAATKLLNEVEGTAA